MSTRIQVVNRAGVPLKEERIRELAESVLAAEAQGGALSVAFLGESEVARLNETYRGLEGPTDVLAFPEEEGEETWPDPEEEPGEGGGYRGDVVICPAVAGENAAAEGSSLEAELEKLVIHGVMHLLGYDHEVDDGEMESREAGLRVRLLPQRNADPGRG